MIQWHSLRLSSNELRPDVTLTNGQCFHWQPHRNDKLQWTGVIDDYVITIKQTDDDTLFAVRHPPSPNQHEIERITDRLNDYFHVTTAPSLSHLYETWQTDERFKRVSAAYRGLRLIRQTPLECVLSFICSSNNHISRITQMLNNLRRLYGTHLCDLEIHNETQTTIKFESNQTNQSNQTDQTDQTDQTNQFNQTDQSNQTIQSSDQDQTLSSSSSLSSSNEVVSFYSFPSLDQLSKVTESELRAPPLNFGYRAKYIISTITTLQSKGGASWLNSLRGKDRLFVEKALTELSGVGPKVACCCALFCLDSFDSVPVDVHVLKIAQRDYADKIHSSLKKKTMTNKLHEDIAQFFRNLFGSHAGWAHSVLFCADLASFKHRLIDYEKANDVNVIKKEIDSNSSNGSEDQITVKIELNTIVNMKYEDVVSSLSDRELRRLKRTSQQVDHSIISERLIDNESINESIDVKPDDVTTKVRVKRRKT